MSGPAGLLLNGDVVGFVVLMGALILALSLHEYGHALAADLQGDPTARLAGRLTVNPLSHLDPIGTFLLAIVGFGWGKPVPFHPRRLRSPRFGAALVGIAGPAANVLLALAAAFLLRYLPPGGASGIVVQFLFLNLLLAIFNLIPIPPLDGSRLLSALLPPHRQHIIYFLDRWGFAVLLLLVFFVLPGPLFAVTSWITIRLLP